jgi:Ion channel
MQAWPARWAASKLRAGPPERAGRFGLLLLVLISTYLLSAFSVGKLAGDLQVLLFLAVLLLALRTSPLPRRWTWPVAVVALTGSAAAFAASVTGTGTGEGASELWKGLILLLTAVLIVRRVLARPTVTLQSIYGALSAYIIIGLMFAAFYAAIENLGAGSFFASGQVASTQTFQYFSFSTLTTLGYGDFTAAGNGGRAIAVMEALTGQVFLATLVARLVSAFRAELPQDVHCAGDDEHRDHQRNSLLGHHHELRPGPDRRDVGRAEGGGRRERQLQVVDELRIPVSRYVLSVGHFGEDEGGLMTRSAGAGRRSAPVEIPVPQAEGEHVSEPDRATAGEQDVGIVAELGVVDEAGDQTHSSGGVYYRDKSDQCPGPRSEPPGVAVDAAGVTDDEYREQDEDDCDEGPAGISGPELRRQDRPQSSGGQHRQRHRPAALACLGRCVQADWRGRTGARHFVK